MLVYQRQGAQHQERGEGADGEDDEPGAEGAAQGLRVGQQVRQEEAADAATGTDDAGRNADARLEAARHQLKHGAVAHAQTGDADGSDRHEQRQRRQRRDQEIRGGDSQKERGEHAQAAEPVRQVAAQGPDHAATEGDDGGQVAGRDGADAVLVAEKDGKEAAEADVAAEGHAVDEAKPPEVGLADERLR